MASSSSEERDIILRAELHLSNDLVVFLTIGYMAASPGTSSSTGPLEETSYNY
jgi:hypothetical protein